MSQAISFPVRIIGSVSAWLGRIGCRYKEVCSQIWWVESEGIKNLPSLRLTVSVNTYILTGRGQVFISRDDEIEMRQGSAQAASESATSMQSGGATHCKSGVPVCVSTPLVCLQPHGVDQVFLECRHVEVCRNGLVAFRACEYDAIPSSCVDSGVPSHGN